MDKITKIVLSVLGILIAIVILVVIIVNIPKKNDNYDISMMHEVNTQDILGMFNDKGTYVVLFGNETCDVCERLLPKMAEAQKQLNYVTQYIDVLSIDFDSETWKALYDKLDMKSTQTMSEDGSGPKVTDTYGYFIQQKMAPIVVIIKNGKQTGGFIGGVDQTNLIGWLKVKIANNTNE